MSEKEKDKKQEKTQEFACPYCDIPKTITSGPDNMVLHIINNHTSNDLDDFKEKYYSEMKRIYNRTRRCVYTIAVYLSIAFLIAGVITFSAWTESDRFKIFGWDWNQYPQTSTESTTRLPKISPNTFKAVMYALSAGAMGAIAYSLYGLVEHYCRYKNFDVIWFAWYLVAPISGAIVGIATYAVIVGGLFVLGDETPITRDWSLFAVTFLTGFSTKKAMRKLTTIAGKIFENAEPEKTEKDTDSNQSQTDTANTDPVPEDPSSSDE